jgi:hypothetical protein
MSDFDLPMTGDEPEPDETLDDPEALADGINLGLDLSPEEQAAAEEMVAHLEAQFKDAIEDEPEPVEEPEPEVPTEEPVSSEAAPVPPSTPGAVVIDGVQVPVEEAVAYLTKREVQREAAARQQAQPAPEPPKPPEWLDTDDPAQVAMWQHQLDLERQIAQIGQNQQQAAQEQVRTRAIADANSGIHTFRTLHPELSESDITTIRTHAAALEIIDGLSKVRSGPDAVAKALDIAYWDLPEFRAQATAAPSPAAVKKAERAEKKEKLNALGGSSGSVPRQEAKPDLSTDRGSRQAAAEWLREQNILPN